ncbi:M1 family metallopeptidase [Flammeovirga sp. SubArs3]|uniref:M1 family metallopeptidase n=1 Tax=Flammeovirga sp. SubArs3 TaxID=2995316 RepID=UPI00248CDD9B|nr:M1 family metallopeptidase [Flammeovirga sp. SubArs3]
MRFQLPLILILSLSSLLVYGQKESYNNNKFKQLDEELPNPNSYRTGSGAPGHKYWQQKADYVIEASLDETKNQLHGEETITYFNNSPSPIKYLWVQLDQNMRATNSNTYKISQNKIKETASPKDFARIDGYPDYDGGHKIQEVTDQNGQPLPYTINQTMMRIDLPQVLKSNENIVFNIKWYYNINDRKLMGGRGGYETFADGNTLYTITQWFPRMAVYDDVNGWQNKQFLGNGEFALTFGDYDVKFTAPADHIVGATGVLQDSSILSEEIRERLEQAKYSEKPIEIVTKKEVIKKEKKKGKVKGTTTWHYKAENVRDFALGSSRKFIWDAMGVEMGDKIVMAMSYYPKEAYELYSRYSTEAVAHTLDVYSRMTFDYPYPVAISVEANNGMEYPMICFNYGRVDKEGHYTKRTKYGMLSVIIHEVGHNYFPMIVNSDERQWTWMDEGLNSFLQFVAEQEWEENYPSMEGFPRTVVDYMKGNPDNISPIMTNSESIHQFGWNAYSKPSVALNILRETVMGRELFDYAFKTYANRWMFKHPTPADFFRTMEDASGVDLDWFWRGWFYTIEPCDISIKNVVYDQLNTKNPEIESARLKAERDQKTPDITTIHNQEEGLTTRLEKKPELKDFYNSYDEYDYTTEDVERYKKYDASLNENDKAWIKENKHIYQVDFENVGGLVMPIIIEFTYQDGSKEKRYIPAEIWKNGDQVVSKVFILDQEVSSFTLDPNKETADIDYSNNYYPRHEDVNRFKLYKSKKH